MIMHMYNHVSVLPLVEDELQQISADEDELDDLVDEDQEFVDNQEQILDNIQSNDDSNDTRMTDKIV